MKPGKNRPCPCESGKKYKLCCMTNEEKLEDKNRFKMPDNEIDYKDIFDSFSERIHDTFEESNSNIKPENPIVDPWWRDFMPHYQNRNVDEILPRLYSFFDEHPDEVINLGLEFEFIYELAPIMEKANKYDEYILIIIRLHDEFPQTFQKAFGSLGRSIIEYQISNQKEVDKFLDNFIKEPEKETGYLNEVLELLAITGRESELKRLTEAVYLPLVESPEVFDGDFAEDKLLNICYNPFLAEKDNSERATLQILENLKNTKLPDLNFEIDHILQYVTNFIEYNQPVEISLFNKKQKYPNLYSDLRWRFAGFLFFETRCSMSASHEFSETAITYIYFLIYEINSKKPFIFNMKHLENYITKICKSFFHIRAIPAITLLQGVIHFYRYLEFTDTPLQFNMGDIINKSTDLKNSVSKVSSGQKSCINRIFSDFPDYKGRVISKRESDC